MVAPFLKMSFSKISFLSIKWCILLAECYSKRGGVLRPEGGMPWHSQGLRECGGDCTENKPISVRLVPSRLGATLHYAGEGFNASGQGIFFFVQTDKLKMLTTRPLERQVFMENFRRAQCASAAPCVFLFSFPVQVPAQWPGGGSQTASSDPSHREGTNGQIAVLHHFAGIASTF